MEPNPRAVIGGNNPPADRTFKKRWATALFSRPDKPMGAVAMGFKLYMEMDGQGRGATVSDAEFQVCCGVSDGACRTFKRWLVNAGFIQILVRGRRGYRSEFLATIPGDQIPAVVAGIPTGEYRQPIPANNLENHPTLPATIAGNPSQDAPAREGSNININNNNNQLASVESTAARGLAGLNGSAEPMLADIRVWMVGGDDVGARQWLATMLSQYTQDIVRGAYLKLKTDIATGVLIAKPLQAWSKIAMRMKAEPAQRAGKDGAPGLTRRERMLQYVEEAQAKQEPRPRHEQ